jgi:hypothetical protein
MKIRWACHVTHIRCGNGYKTLTRNNAGNRQLGDILTGTGSWEMYWWEQAAWRSTDRNRQLGDILMRTGSWETYWWEQAAWRRTDGNRQLGDLLTVTGSSETYWREQGAGRRTDRKIILKCIFKKTYVVLIYVLTIGYSDGLLWTW